LPSASTARRQRHILELGHQARGERGRHLELEPGPDPEVELQRARLLGYGNSRKPQHDRLQRGGNGPGVRDVVAQVRTVVDPGDHQLGLESLDQTEVREPHAVDRGAVGGIAHGAVIEVDLLHPQRATGGDRARHRRAVAVGGDHGQLHRGQAQQSAPQLLEPGRLDPIVVGQQNAHGVNAMRQRGVPAVAEPTLGSRTSSTGK
jgi:hypothetical protein